MRNDALTSFFWPLKKESWVNVDAPRIVPRHPKTYPIKSWGGTAAESILGGTNRRRSPLHYKRKPLTPKKTVNEVRGEPKPKIIFDAVEIQRVAASHGRGARAERVQSATNL